MTREILIADLFCGAGGSSSGAKRALARLGLKMTLACVNHWPVAIATHKKNHPEARHYCMDLESAKPEEIVPEGRLDLLMASPTCTHHSRARGGKPTSDQQRMDPWHVVRWCTALKVDRLLVENVPEFVEWGPVCLETLKPIKERKGEYFRAWVEALRAIGFDIEHRVVNAADHGDATTRRRFFLQGRADGKPIRWPDPTHARRDKAGALGLKPWRPAREIIDWTRKGRSLYNRKKPLAENTLRRIGAGLVKFQWPEPFLIVFRRYCDALGIDSPLPTITALARFALVEPFILNRHGDNGGVRAHPINAPIPTPTCRGAGYLIEPFVVGCGGRAGQSPPAPAAAPLGTITAKNDRALVEPFVVPNFGERAGQNPRTHDVADPLPAVTGHGAGAIIAADEQQFDILFRMLEPGELAAAMGFSDAETAYEFTGTKTEIIRQIGNAVPVKTSAALVAAMFDAAAQAAGCWRR